MRPRPRLLATVDARSGGGAHVLASLAGLTARITPLATEVLACDATVVPVVFDGPQPVGVGDSVAIPHRVRTAVVARDGGCRFPGCRAPVAWTDAHHIVPLPAGPSTVDNLVLLCRRCHRRVHRLRWRIDLQPDGLIAFTRRGTRYTSRPRARPVARE